MSVEEARNRYLGSAFVATFAKRCRDVHCGLCRWAYLRTDAASLAYDLAVAEASIERTRRGVAWG